MPKRAKFKFIDLFAGIGGFHIAMQRLGGECVFASEIDENARKTYELNHKKSSPKLFKNNLFNSDIRSIAASEIPDFDVLCAGFPCQPFSQAGYKRGFDDAHNSERGNLFFYIAEILDAKRPKAFFLENVRGLATHDNGNTLKVILNILRSELGYSAYHKIVKATDYGLPQHRPRTFIIGFRDDNSIFGFNFPEKTPLKFNMSDVWEGVCEREIGFTLRVGGRGSNINDRRNWDAYMVDGQVKKIGPKEGLKMQGFPDDFEFPVSKINALKQLGNSVAVDAIQTVGNSMIEHMFYLDEFNNTTVNNNETMTKLNKGEWAEPYAFLKILKDKKLHLSDENLNKKEDFLDVTRVSNDNLGFDFLIFKGDKVNVRDKFTKTETTHSISDLIPKSTLDAIIKKIKTSQGTFNIPEFSVLESKVNVRFTKGGNSNQKSDIDLDFIYKGLSKKNEGLGIKSLLGAKPTLLNASSNTNFIYAVIGLGENDIDKVNSIDSTKKIQDRIKYIWQNSARLEFYKTEKDVMHYNLNMVDSSMPIIVSELLLAFFSSRYSKITDLVDYVHSKGELVKKVDYQSKEALVHKVKKLLLDYTCGFFPGSKWDGSYSSNGTIVVDETGELHGYHIVDMESFKDYLYTHTKFDTPSSSRHGFGKLYSEKNKRQYFKLNLQLRYL